MDDVAGDRVDQNVLAVPVAQAHDVAHLHAHMQGVLLWPGPPNAPMTGMPNQELYGLHNPVRDCFDQVHAPHDAIASPERP